MGLYDERMTDYYPAVVQSIMEYKAIISGEYPEFSTLNSEKEAVLSDAYLETMGENRISEWETLLNIQPLVDATIEERRDNIIARLRGSNKLNSKLINSIVNAFTGGSANSYIEDSVLHVEINPPKGNKQYEFPTVTKEIKRRLPIHLDLEVIRKYYTWQQITNNYSTWNDVKNGFDDWRGVYLSIPSE